jgi:Zn-dependent protease
MPLPEPESPNSAYDEPSPRSLLIHPPRRPYWLHLLLLLLTAWTMLVVGARMEYQFLHQQPLFVDDADFFAWQWVMSEPARLWMGVPFAGALLAILLAHEFGHFVYAWRYGVYATLPYFLPAPTPIGTFGAFIQIKSPFPSRQSLFDMAVAGPMAGFLVVVPVLLTGLTLSLPVPLDHGSATSVGLPPAFHLAFYGLEWLGVYGRGVTGEVGLYLHPVAVAAWTGLLATALNLLPAGQLDGGHMVYALKPQAHRRTTLLVIALMAPLALFFWSGWLVWLLALRLMMRHPAVAVYPPLPGDRRRPALAAAVIFLLSFTPMPLAGGSLLDLIEVLLHAN